MIALFLILATVESKFEPNVHKNKRDFCETLICEDADPICGIREEGKGYRLRLFGSECELLKYGCKVKAELAYGFTSMNDCERSFGNVSQTSVKTQDQPLQDKSPKKCTEFDCSYPGDAKEVCGIRKDGKGYRIRLFENICKLWQYNCEHETKFTESEKHICNALQDNNNTTQEFKSKTVRNKKARKNIVIVDSSMINFNDFNESIENFFAATHVFDLPLQDIQHSLNKTGRRRLVNVFGPQLIFKPWITIPKNISEDFYHLPTLSSCYHKCPTTCPDTYAPVCGVPGIVAREPSLMFQNHCFMDVAQCKMFWEDKSETSMSSNYIESSFLFCLGDEMNGLFRFLPLIRTLQHMGRLKKKGHYNYKLKNMRFFNNLLSREPHIMG